MPKMKNPVPSEEEFAHVMTTVTPAPSLEEWEKTHMEMVKHLEKKYNKPFRKIVKECGKNREPQFPEPP